MPRVKKQTNPQEQPAGDKGKEAASKTASSEATGRRVLRERKVPVVEVVQKPVQSKRVKASPKKAAVKAPPSKKAPAKTAPKAKSPPKTSRKIQNKKVAKDVSDNEDEPALEDEEKLDEKEEEQEEVAQETQNKKTKGRSTKTAPVKVKDAPEPKVTSRQRAPKAKSQEPQEIEISKKPPTGRGRKAAVTKAPVTSDIVEENDETENEDQDQEVISEPKKRDKMIKKATGTVSKANDLPKKTTRGVRKAKNIVEFDHDESAPEEEPEPEVVEKNTVSKPTGRGKRAVTAKETNKKEIVEKASPVKHSTRRGAKKIVSEKVVEDEPKKQEEVQIEEKSKKQEEAQIEEKSKKQEAQIEEKSKKQEARIEEKLKKQEARIEEKLKKQEAQTEEKPKKEKSKPVKELKNETESAPKPTRGRKAKVLPVEEKKTEEVKEDKIEPKLQESQPSEPVATGKGRGRKASVKQAKEIPLKEPLSKEVPSKEVPSKEIPSKEISSKKIASEDQIDAPKVQKSRGKRKGTEIEELPAKKATVINNNETVIGKTSGSTAAIDETVVAHDNLEVIETVEMLINETIFSHDSTLNDDEDDEPVAGIKRKAEDAKLQNDTFDVTKKLRVEDYARIITVGTPIAGELGPQQRLFNGQKVASTMPRIISYPGENGVKMLASGAFHNIFIDDDDRLKTFGCNDDGALGRDTLTPPEDYSDDENEYEEKAGLNPAYVECEDVKFKKVSAGDIHSAALDFKGNVWVFGNIKDESHKLGLFPDSKSVMVNDEDGTLVKTSDFQATRTPEKVDIADEKAVDIASGNHHIVILTESGNVYTFGEGSKGQLGRIKLENLESIKTKRELFLKPHIVTFKKLELSEKIIKVFAGQWSSYAVTNFGNLYSWGLNNYYQLGFETTSTITLPSQPDVKYCFELMPVKVPLEFRVQQVAVGQQHLLLLDNESNIHSCGNGIYGRLGLSKISSNKSAEDFTTPQLIEKERFDNEEMSSVACGDFFSLGLSKNGNVYAWGQASEAIGCKDESDDIFRPRKYSGPVIEAYRITQISAGSGFAAFIGERY